MATLARWIGACALAAVAWIAWGVLTRETRPPEGPQPAVSGEFAGEVQPPEGARDSIAGVVVWQESGVPVAHACIEAWSEPAESSSESRSKVSLGLVASDSNGRFSLDDLREQSCAVTASAWTPTIFLKGGAQPPNILPVRISGVRTGVANLRIEVRPGSSIAGIVRLEDGSLVREGHVQVTPAARLSQEMIDAVDPPVYYYWTVGAPLSDGRFEVIGLESVEHVVLIRSPGFPPVLVRRRPGEDSGDVTIRRGGTVQGRVTNADGVGVPDVWVRAVRSEFDRTNAIGDKTNSDGTFVIRRLRADSYSLIGLHMVDGELRTAFELERVVVTGGAVTDLGDVPVVGR